MSLYFETRKRLNEAYENLILKENIKQQTLGNGVYDRYENPILTADHSPVFWKYDFNESTNPYLMERFGINAVFNAGALKLDDKYIVIARVEGNDRKSFSLWQKVIMVQMVSDSGIILLQSLKQIYQIQISMTCVLYSMKMAGSTDYFVQSEEILKLFRVISLLL